VTLNYQGQICNILEIPRAEFFQNKDEVWVYKTVVTYISHITAKNIFRHLFVSVGIGKRFFFPTSSH
jgi:hypothetical protein